MRCEDKLDRKPLKGDLSISHGVFELFGATLLLLYGFGDRNAVLLTFIVGLSLIAVTWLRTAENLCSALQTISSSQYCLSIANLFIRGIISVLCKAGVGLGPGIFAYWGFFAYWDRCYIPFNIQGIPVTKKFIDRPTEMQILQGTLLLESRTTRRNVFVLRGLGGIGKIQLAVEFVRRHHKKFSAVF